MAGHRVKYVMAAKLVNELVEAADERVLSKTIARYGRVDLLCLDELGYMELDRRGAELLFQVLTEREETSSVAIASNESFSGWTKTFTDPRLCAAIVDRLTFVSSVRYFPGPGVTYFPGGPRGCVYRIGAGLASGGGLMMLSIWLARWSAEGRPSPVAMTTCWPPRRSRMSQICPAGRPRLLVLPWSTSTCRRSRLSGWLSR